MVSSERGIPPSSKPKNVTILSKETKVKPGFPERFFFVVRN